MGRPPTAWGRPIRASGRDGASLTVHARPVVTLYGRQGCHLCDETLVLLQRLSRTLDFTTETVDIESDEELLRRYVFEIPVITLGEVELARAPVSPAALEDALREHLR